MTGALQSSHPAHAPAGVLFVLAGASGVGKGTVREAALPAVAPVSFSVSATTRAQRPHEQEGRDYFFKTPEAFEQMVQQDDLLEWAEYVGDRYGTPRTPVEAALARGEDILLEVDLEGARQIKRRKPAAVTIFLVPPSLDELERRLRERGTDSDDKIAKRLRRAEQEIAALKEFDYVIVNDVLEDAVTAFQSVVRAERLKSVRWTDEAVARLLP
jgi:guanylate kinase